MQTQPIAVKELSYDAYQARQYAEISPNMLTSRARSLAIGGRARWDGERWSPLPYPGFAMQAMLEASFNCEALFMELQDVQRQVVACLPEPGILYPLPAKSFHQTVANAFSAERLERHVEQTGRSDALQEAVARCVASWQAPSGRPPVMRLVGLSVFRTAIGILGVFDNAADFQRIIAFRDRFYGDPELAEMGLRRTRPFIGHVTLAYVEAELREDDKRRLVEGICRVNASLRDRRLVMELPRAELRRYDDLSDFLTDPAYPQASL